MSVDQALYEMELVGHDFFLFSDVETGRASVVYRRHAYDYGLIRLTTDGSRARRLHRSRRTSTGSASCLPARHAEARVTARTMAAVVLAKILRAGEGKQVRRLSAIADHIETLEEDYVDLSDAELRALTDTFKQRLRRRDARRHPARGLRGHP